MIKLFHTCAVAIDKLNKGIGTSVSYLTVVMALVMFAIVLLRYGFNVGSIALQESITYLHAMVFLLGASFTFQHDRHVRVDIFYRDYSPRKKSILNLMGALLFMLPVSVYISVACWDYVMQSWSLLEGSREPGGLPLVYALKSFLLIFSLSLMLQAISEITKHSIDVFITRKTPDLLENERVSNRQRSQ